MKALEFITGHVIYNPAYTYKIQLKTAIDGGLNSPIATQHNFKNSCKLKKCP